MVSLFSVDSQFLNCVFDNSRIVIFTIQELWKSQCNNTDINNTDYSDTDPFLSVPDWMGQDKTKLIYLGQKENHGCHLHCDSHGMCYILSIKAKTTACCSSLSLAQRSRSFFWDSVRETVVSPSANNWDNVMPNATHIFSREGIVGTIFLRYQEDMVDWGKPECSASWYSVQPRSSRYVVMAARISFTTLTPLLVFFVNYTSMNRCNLIICVV